MNPTLWDTKQKTQLSCAWTFGPWNCEMINEWQYNAMFVGIYYTAMENECSINPWFMFNLSVSLYFPCVSVDSRSWSFLCYPSRSILPDGDSGTHTPSMLWCSHFKTWVIGFQWQERGMEEGWLLTASALKWHAANVYSSLARNSCMAPTCPQQRLELQGNTENI